MNPNAPKVPDAIRTNLTDVITDICNAKYLSGAMSALVEDMVNTPPEDLSRHKIGCGLSFQDLADIGDFSRHEIIRGCLLYTCIRRTFSNVMESQLGENEFAMFIMMAGDVVHEIMDPIANAIIHDSNSGITFPPNDKYDEEAAQRALEKIQDYECAQSDSLHILQALSELFDAPSTLH